MGDSQGRSQQTGEADPALRTLDFILSDMGTDMP